MIWVTLRVPEGTKPGEYRGTLFVRHSSQPPVPVRLLVKILPFTLPPSPAEETLYYPRPAEPDEMLFKELKDLREHGACVPIPAMEARVKSRDEQFGPDDVAETLAHSQRLLRAFREVFGEWRFPASFSPSPG